MKRIIALCFILLLVSSTGSFLVLNIKAEENSSFRWASRKSMPTPRAMFGSTVFNSKIYVMGGQRYAGDALTVNEAYDPTTDSWNSEPNLPIKKRYPYVENVLGKIYVIGGDQDPLGWVVGTSNDIYDPEKGEWTTGAPIPYKQGAAASCVCNNKIYIIGGYTPEYNPNAALDFNQAYDPAKDEWLSSKLGQLASLPTPRRHLSAISLNNRIYVIGGETIPGRNQAVPVGTNEMYDPATNTWTNKAPMPTPRIGLSLVTLNNKIYAIGGATYSDGKLIPLNTVEEYDPLTDSWRKIESMPTPRAWAGAEVISGTIYVIGGWNGSSVVNVNEAFTEQEYWKTKLHQLVEKVEEAEDAALEFSKFNIDEGSNIIGDMTIDIAVDIASIGIGNAVEKALKIDFNKLPKISQLTLVGIDEILKTLTADAIKSKTDRTIGYELLKAAAVKGGMGDIVNFTKLSEIYELAFNRFKRTIDVTIEVWSKTGAPTSTELDFMAQQWYMVLNFYIDALEKAKTSSTLYVSPSRGAGGLGQVAETKRWWSSPLKIIGYDYGLIALSILYILLGQAGLGITVTDLMSLGVDAKIALVIWDTINQILIENLAIAEDFQAILTFNLVRSLDFPNLYSRAPGQIEEETFSEVSLTKSGEGSIKYKHLWQIETKIFASAVFFDPDGGFMYWTSNDKIAVSSGTIMLNLSYPFPGLWFLVKFAGRAKMQFKAFIHLESEGPLIKQYLIGPIEGDVAVKTITLFGVSLGSPADLHVYDASGRHVGLNYATGEIEVSIPNAYYSGPHAEPQVILIPIPSDSYTVYLKGRDGGTYNLTVFCMKNGAISSRVVKKGIIAQGEETKYNFQISSTSDVEEILWWAQHQLWIIAGVIGTATILTISIAIMKKRKKCQAQPIAK